MTQTPIQQYPSVTPPPAGKKRRWPKFVAIGATALVAGAIGASIGTASNKTPTVSPKATVSAPAKVAPAKPAAFKPVTLLEDTGTGTEVTPSFVSQSGDYKVVWIFSDNSDQYGNASNFIMTEDGGSDLNAMTLPNDIQSAGTGSTEITDDPGTHTFDVQALGTWQVVVVSAP
jgi:hypothetical protein